MASAGPLLVTRFARWSRVVMNAWAYVAAPFGFGWPAADLMHTVWSSKRVKCCRQSLERGSYMSSTLPGKARLGTDQRKLCHAPIAFACVNPAGANAIRPFEYCSVLVRPLTTVATSARTWSIESAQIVDLCAIPGSNAPNATKLTSPKPNSCSNLAPSKKLVSPDMIG